MARDSSTDLIVAEKPTSSAQPSDELWLRLSGFLSTRSPNTQRTYLGIIREWAEFLGATVGSAEAARRMCSAQDLDAMRYIAWLRKRPGQKPRHSSKKNNENALSTERKAQSQRDGTQHSLSNATIAKKCAALRRIYRMLMAHEFGVLHNPFDTDRVPAPSASSGQKRPTEMIQLEKVRRVLDAPDINTPKGVRDRALLAVLFGGGLRRSEAANLRLSDVRKTPGGTFYLRLRSTKAKRDVDQAVPNWASERLGTLIEQRKQMGAEPADYLFTSFRGQGGRTPTAHPISTSGIYRLFKHYCEEAGANEFASPHSARATAITKLLDDGKTHREVQEFSRHASVQMVEVYDKRRIGVDENPATDLDYD